MATRRLSKLWDQGRVRPSLRLAAGCERGALLTEALVALVILVVVLPSFLAASGVAVRHLTVSARDQAWSAAVQSQVEEIQAAGFSGAGSDTATINGVAMSWTVTGTDPRIVTLVAAPAPGQPPSTQPSSHATADTLMIALLAADTLS